MKKNPRPKWPLSPELTNGTWYRNPVFVSRVRGVDIYHCEGRTWPDKWVPCVAMLRGGHQRAVSGWGGRQAITHRNDFHPEARAFALSLLNLIS